MNFLRRTWDLYWTAYLRFDKHDGSALAGYIAFSGLLALFPFLIFAVAMIGEMVGEADSLRAIDALFRLAPPHIAQTIEPVLHEVLAQQRGGLLTLSFAATVWIASSAVEAIRMGFDRAYDVEDARSFLVRRGTAFLFVILGAFVAFFLGLTVIFSPFFVSLAEKITKSSFESGTVTLSYASGFLVFVFVLYITHRFLPGKSMRSARVWPGVFLTSGLFLAGALGFSIYLSYAPSYTLTYGTLAGVIVTLLFFYLVGTALIYGAEVNATLAAAAHEPMAEEDEDAQV
jgi:membrane protein